MSAQNCNRFVVIGCMPLFAACGGGDGDQSRPVSSQSPTPSPTLASSGPVVIFSNPTAQQYASLGSSTTSAGDGYSPVAPTARLTDISLEAVNQPLLRYTSSDLYEIRLPGAGFDRLVPYAGMLNPTPENNFFQPSSARQNYATFIIVRSRLDGYRDSELAGWTDATSLARMGWLAFGIPTPASAIATSGTATYRGRVAGIVDITEFDNLYGGDYFSAAEGTVTLTVHFATRSITGTLAISVYGETEVSSVPFSTTTIPDADTHSGLFETAQSGFNEFKVRLTGPDANELIGSWAVPIMVDGEPHQFMGAWIAARN